MFCRTFWRDLEINLLNIVNLVLIKRVMYLINEIYLIIYPFHVSSRVMSVGYDKCISIDDLI